LPIRSERLRRPSRTTT
jgi:hypothetical protein